MTVDQRRLRQIRDLVLAYVYEHGAGSPNFDVSGRQIEQALGLTREEMSAVTMLMLNQKLLAERGQVGCIGLSFDGQAEAERLGPSVLLREPPPSSIHVQQNYGVVQIGGAGSNQTANLSIQNAALQQVFTEIERAIPTLNISEGEKEHAKALLSSLRSGVGTIADAGLKAIGASLGGILTAAGSSLGKRLAELLGISLLG